VIPQAAFTATAAAPWSIDPADSKPTALAFVQAILLAMMESLDLSLVKSLIPTPGRAGRRARTGESMKTADAA